MIFLNLYLVPKHICGVACNPVESENEIHPLIIKHGNEKSAFGSMIFPFNVHLSACLMTGCLKHGTFGSTQHCLGSIGNIL